MRDNDIEKVKTELLSSMNFDFDFSKAKYELDALQNRLLEFYLRADTRFRRAFSLNYTGDFIQYFKDKAKLREPIHISMIGQVRGGKSSSAITLCCILSAFYGRKFGVEYICANAYEFLEKLRTFPEEKLYNSVFLIDEEKQATYGIGSIARKIKLQDVQNIIAKNNISTISINPTKWANQEAHYGLRVFGRCFTTKTCRLMLYNLQEKGKGGELPLGNIYLPIFNVLLPNKWAEELNREYLKKKDEWIMQEMRGEGDVFAELRRKTAESFIKDNQFLNLKKKAEKITYISQKLGSEWTKSEILEIFEITKLLQQGIEFE